MSHINTFVLTICPFKRFAINNQPTSMYVCEHFLQYFSLSVLGKTLMVFSTTIVYFMYSIILYPANHRGYTHIFTYFYSEQKTYDKQFLMNDVLQMQKKRTPFKPVSHYACLFLMEVLKNLYDDNVFVSWNFSVFFLIPRKI